MIYTILAALAGLITGIVLMFMATHRRFRRIRSLTKYVVFSIAVTIIYTVAEFVMSLKTGISHDVLSGCVYTFFAGELVLTGLIKIFKLREENKECDVH